MKISELKHGETYTVIKPDGKANYCLWWNDGTITTIEPGFYTDYVFCFSGESKPCLEIPKTDITDGWHISDISHPLPLEMD